MCYSSTLPERGNANHEIINSISYWLIKFTPLWGLSLIATSTIYLAPLIYKSNKLELELGVTTQLGGISREVGG